MSLDSRFLILDTSTLIGAILKPSSLPAEVYYHAAKKYRLLASDETLREIMDVVQRDKFDRFRSPEERNIALSYYLNLVEIITPTMLSADCRDEKDNKFLSLALSAKADIIVSSDDDLLVMNPYKAIRILSVRQYAEENGLI